MTNFCRLLAAMYADKIMEAIRQLSPETVRRTCQRSLAKLIDFVDCRPVT